MDRINLVSYNVHRNNHLSFKIVRSTFIQSGNKSDDLLRKERIRRQELDLQERDAIKNKGNNSKSELKYLEVKCMHLQS